MARLAQSLAKVADVEILSLNPRKHRADAALAPLPARAVDIDTSRLALPIGAPFIVRRFVSREFRARLAETLERFKPDVVQFESPFMLPYARDVRGAKRVLRSLNVEFRIWEGLAAIERNPLRRFAMRRVAASLGRYELREMNRLDAIVPITQADADDFRALGCTRPMHVVPCGASPSSGGRRRSTEASVAFIGSLDFRPNRDALRWIREELWPRVIARAPEARLSIAGSAPPEGVREAEDADAFMREASVFISPLFAGGGMRIKVLDALALGKPVVATTIGAGGIDCRDLVIADDAEAFADAVVRLLRDPVAAERLGAAARACVAERYDSDALARGLLRFYESL